MIVYTDADHGKSDEIEVRLEDRMLEQRSLVERRGLDMLVLQREQVSTREGVRS